MSGANKEAGCYDVERIVGYRKSERMMRDEYLVKWEGCEEYTFEPVYHLNGCRKKVSEFHDRILKSAGVQLEPTMGKAQDFDSGSDLILPPEAKEKMNILKRLYPLNDECGIAKGWKVSKILGAQLRNKPYTYLVQYEDHKQVEHLDVDYVNDKCPEAAKQFYQNIDKPYPRSCYPGASRNGFPKHRQWSFDNAGANVIHME